MTARVTVSKEFTFDAAHRLPNHDGKCANLHGHTYRARVTFAGPLQQDGKATGGMVMDFSNIASLLGMLPYDHAVLLRIDDPLWSKLHGFARLVAIRSDPTAEVLAEDLASKLGDLLKGVSQEVTVVRVELWETPTSCAVWESLA